MRHIPEAIASALMQGPAKLCHAWIVTRRDGVKLGFTDHDRSLNVLGVDCQGLSGFTTGASAQGLGIEDASDAAITGVISSEAISATDIAAGLYDEAAILTCVVDWSDPSQLVEVFTGTLGRFEARGGLHDGAGSFVAHVEGPLAKLERVIGRRFTHLCDAALGDARCGISPALGAVCDKRYRTCCDIFHNTVNFRGFPDLPGEDFLTLYPRIGDTLDGASRGEGSGR